MLVSFKCRGPGGPEGNKCSGIYSRKYCKYLARLIFALVKLYLLHDNKLAWVQPCIILSQSCLNHSGFCCHSKFAGQVCYFFLFFVAAILSVENFLLLGIVRELWRQRNCQGRYGNLLERVWYVGRQCSLCTSGSVTQIDNALALVKCGQEHGVKVGAL